MFFPAAFVHFVSLYHILIIFTELEAEPEEMTELLQSPDKSWMHEEVFLMDEQSFLRCNLLLVKMLVRLFKLQQKI